MPAIEDLPEIGQREWHARQSSNAPAPARAEDLRKRGFSFVGPTTVHAFMQAMGLVNDHLTGCDVRDAAEKDRADFIRPT